MPADTRQQPGPSPLVRALTGAAAGALGTWVMGKVTTYLYAHEDAQARQREDAARGGKTAFGVAAEKVAQALGTTLSASQQQRAGTAIHWATGAMGGALYGLLRPRMQAVGAGRGVAFGGAFFLLMDEAANYLLGLTPGPAAFPWQAHARGLAGHVVYGAATDGALAVVERVA